ncbi:MAG: phytoene desaturase [Bacteroidetes bacterium]|nr:phytoene desaturase [Bacteroidota bacterium]MCH8523257.1 phytoene desaturase [Balneolales bacterium]
MAHPNRKYGNVVIIGAGIGGLTAACLLAFNGSKVTIIEKNERVGGKMNQFEKGGYRFDTGPSLLTMPGILGQLFEHCGERMEEYLELLPLEPVCRYYFDDGTRFDAFDQLEKTQNEIQKFAPEDVDAYARFLDYSRQIYNRTADVFLFHPLRSYRDLLQLPVSDAFKIDAFTTVSKRVDKMLTSGYMRQFFKRFATYNGSSPYMAPATINVISHVEMNQGGYYVKGGLYQIALALEKLALKLGVKIKTDTIARRIDMHDDIAEGVTTEDGYYMADLVVANADAHETYLHLLPHYVTPAAKRRQIDKTEPSCSGFVLMLGCNREWNEKLAHHTIFFSNNYKAEFDDIFKQNKLPVNPTIYVANSSFSDPDHAPSGGSNLFILVNAPYLHETQDWDEEEIRYSNLIIDKLEQYGLTGLKESIVVKETITPRDFYHKYKSNRGSIYGTSSNSMFAAFMRPRNRSPYVENVWLVGGSTHPGGGIPLAALSAFHACDVKVDSSRV